MQDIPTACVASPQQVLDDFYAKYPGIRTTYRRQVRPDCRLEIALLCVTGQCYRVNGVTGRFDRSARVDVSPSGEVCKLELLKGKLRRMFVCPVLCPLQCFFELGAGLLCGVAACEDGSVVDVSRRGGLIA